MQRIVKQDKRSGQLKIDNLKEFSGIKGVTRYTEQENEEWQLDLGGKT